MNHGSLFSGIGGFDLAAEWMGWENIFHCEWNPFGQKKLKKHFPNTSGHGDITTTDFTVYRGTIDVLTGGFPCQPYSMAGKRKGNKDDRHLWPEMLRAIREIQPNWIVGENVYGLINWSGGMVLRDIKADLESEGFTMFSPIIIPACAKKARHRRDRLWIVAHANSHRLQGRSETTKRVSRFVPSSLSAWEARPSDLEKQLPQSPIFRTLNGIPGGVDRVKALGNAIVPQIAYEIFKAIEAAHPLR